MIHFLKLFFLQYLQILPQSCAVIILQTHWFVTQTGIASRSFNVSPVPGVIYQLGTFHRRKPSHQDFQKTVQQFMTRPHFMLRNQTIKISSKDAFVFCQKTQDSFVFSVLQNLGGYYSPGFLTKFSSFFLKFSPSIYLHYTVASNFRLDILQYSEILKTEKFE